jgi:RHS repeat-associated protein
MEWTYAYDANSNLVNADFQIGNTSFLYEFNARILRAGYNEVTYNEGGGLASRGGYTFQYNRLDQLTHVYFGKQLRKEVVYDLVGRPVLVRDRARDEVSSLLYALDSRPWLLTHCMTDRFYSLTYNAIDQLIAIEDGKKIYMVITSPAGTPEIVFSEGGESVKEVSMSPFGTVLQDSNEDFRTCVGYHGGIDLEETGIVIIEGRPYDTILGTWMVPDTNRMLALPKNPADVFLYRFKNNDPINAAGRPDVESLEGWLDLFDLGLATLARPVLDPGRLASSLQPTAALKLTEQQEAHGDSERMEAVLDPSVQASLSFEGETRPQAVGRFFHIKSPLLGPNIILTTSEDGTSTVIQTYTIEEANPFEKTLARLLNNTIKLENYGDNPDTIYFLAPAGFLPTDVASLKTRMAVEERAVPPHGTEICFHTQESR